MKRLYVMILCILALVGCTDTSQRKFPASCDLNPMIASMEGVGRVGIIYTTTYRKDQPSEWLVSFTRNGDGINLKVDSYSANICDAVYETYDKVFQVPLTTIRR